MMPIQLEGQAEIDEFLPPLVHHINLSDISQVKGVGPVTTPDIIKRDEGTAPGYYEFRYSLQKALENSIDVILEVHNDYAKKFGRSYGNGMLKSLADHTEMAYLRPLKQKMLIQLFLLWAQFPLK